MTTKYNIGRINEAKLTGAAPNGLGFTLVGNDITLQNCINSVRGGENPIISKYVAIPTSSRPETTDNPLTLKGKCYKGSLYDPIVNEDDTLGPNNYDIYSIPDNICNTIDNCLKNTSISKLTKEKEDVENLIEKNNKELIDVNIRLTAIQKGQTYENAELEYKSKLDQAELQKKLKILNDKKKDLEAHKNSLIARNSEASILLSDKNRLLATVNSSIQQKYTRLEDVNNKINTITQDIYTNNMEMKRKENIIHSLRVILIIIVIMIVILLVYLGMDYVEANHPNAFENLTNRFNKGRSLFI